MTIGELIDELKKYDPAREAETECSSCGHCSRIDDIEPKGRRYPEVLLLKS